jgi:hypothetical protein
MVEVRLGMVGLRFVSVPAAWDEREREGNDREEGIL